MEQTNKNMYNYCAEFPVPIFKKKSTTTKFYVKSLKQSKNSFVWNLLHKFIFFVSQIVCKLGKKCMVCNKKNSRNPLSRNLAISKKILLKQFQEKKDHYNTKKRFLPLFHGLWSIQTSVEQRRTFAKWGYSLLNSCIFFSNFQFSQNVTTDFQFIYLLIFYIVKSRWIC